MSDRPLRYADAGVDLDAAERATSNIARIAARTHGPEVLGGVGGFGGLFVPDLRDLREPVLVSGSDGVGTKLEIARQLDVLDTVGRDLVAMVVDDLVVPGARPLFFQDYLAVGRLDPDRVAVIVGGIADGCLEAGCALVGGETAEHPGVLAEDAFDLAGFGVGVVERDRILGAHKVTPGDVLVALPSSGLHSNGYSLVRRIVDSLDLTAQHGLARPLGAELLEPTRIHTPDCLALLDNVDVRALCHVTGGGLPGNLPRVLPDATVAHVDAASWQRPAVFDWLIERGPVALDDAWRTFNMGVGMVVVVGADETEEAIALLAGRGVDAWVLGEVREGEGSARVEVHGRG